MFNGRSTPSEKLMLEFDSLVNVWLQLKLYFHYYPLFLIEFLFVYHNHFFSKLCYQLFQSNTNNLHAIVLFNVFLSVVTKQKVTEWEITQTEFGNEMKIFITLIKYDITSGVKNMTYCLWWLFSRHISPLHSSVQRIYEDWGLPINVQRYGI